MMAKKPKPKPKAKKSAPSQRERFVIAARNAGALESESAFDAAFARVVRPPKKREAGT